MGAFRLETCEKGPGHHTIQRLRRSRWWGMFHLSRCATYHDFQGGKRSLFMFTYLSSVGPQVFLSVQRLWFENSFPRFGYRFDLFFCIHLVDGHLVLPELLLDKTMEAGLLAGHTSLASWQLSSQQWDPILGESFPTQIYRSILRDFPKTNALFGLVK